MQPLFQKNALAAPAPTRALASRPSFRHTSRAMPSAPRNCPFCAVPPEPGPWPDMHGRPLRRCPACRLLYADAADLPPPDRERDRYLLHRNTPDDAGYVRFLRRLWTPLRPLLPAGAHLLDYGSGPAPVLAEIVRADGFPCAAYDPFFAPAPPPEASAPYEAILACEVVEHFHRPLESWRHIRSLLAPGGHLAVMTSLPPDAPEAFSRWPYAGDFTHVAFYTRETLQRIADLLHLALLPKIDASSAVHLFRALP